MDKDDIARIRALPLEAVLQRLGAERDPKDPAHNWRLGASRITVTDARFYDHNGAGALHRMRDGRAGGGGAIDLVQYLKDVGFREAVRELGGARGLSRGCSGGPLSLEHRSDICGHTAAADARPGQSRARALVFDGRADDSRSDCRAGAESGRVFADARGNVVFRLRDEAGQEVGYEVRGTYEKPYHSVHGEKGMFITKGRSHPERRVRRIGHRGA